MATEPEPEPRYETAPSIRKVVLWVLVAAVVIGGSLTLLGYLVQ